MDKPSGELRGFRWDKAIERDMGLETPFHFPARPDLSPEEIDKLWEECYEHFNGKPFTIDRINEWVYGYTVRKLNDLSHS